jgi:hypothetical protein
MGGVFDSNCRVLAAVGPAPAIPICPAHQDPPGSDTRSAFAAAPILAGAALGQDSSGSGTLRGCGQRAAAGLGHRLPPVGTREHLKVPQELYPPPHAGLPAGASIRGVAWGANCNVTPMFRASTVLPGGAACASGPHNPAPTGCRGLSTVLVRCNTWRRRCASRCEEDSARQRAWVGLAPRGVIGRLWRLKAPENRLRSPWELACSSWDRLPYLWGSESCHGGLGARRL